MNSSLSLVTALALMCLGAAQAGGAGRPPAPPLLPATPSALAGALRVAGYDVRPNPARPDRDPSLTVRAGGRELDIWLSGCKASAHQPLSCLRVTASTSWDTATPPSPAVVNTWNSNYYTQAYVYHERYFLDSSQILSGGFTQAALNAWLSEYLADLEEFEQQFP